MSKSVYVTVVSLPDPILRDLMQTLLSHTSSIWDHRMTAVLVILLVVASSIVGWINLSCSLSTVSGVHSPILRMLR